MSRRADSLRGQRGFTLLELLLALSLLVILTGALYGSYFALIKGREKATAGMESRRELRTTLDLIRREISSIIYKSGDKRLRFLVEDRDMFGKPASVLAFTTITPPAPGEATVSDLSDIKYQVLEDKGSMLLSRQAKDLHFTSDPPRYPQIEKVEGFLVECRMGDKWVRSWDTAINPALPKAVRVTVTVREDEKLQEYAILATPRIIPQ